MIFICVGSREYQFNRLLKKIDELIDNEYLKETVFAQIGQSDYLPRNYKYERFLSTDVFIEYQKKSDLILSHGGTGALIGALKLGKQVIAIPRLKEFGEHIDDHQLQITGVLEEQGYLKTVIDIDNLYETITNIKENPIIKKYEKQSIVLEIINDFIDKI